MQNTRDCSIRRFGVGVVEHFDRHFHFNWRALPLPDSVPTVQQAARIVNLFQQAGVQYLRMPRHLNR